VESVVTKISLVSGLIALALSAGAAANAPLESQQPVYIEGGQYTAVLSQRTQSWRLLPADGIDLAVNAAESGCNPGGRLPPGLWLVTQDGDGRPVLSAPSHTTLPDGHPEQVALRACGELGDGTPYVAAPQGLIEWLSYRTGAILVED
jgi:hypothetical protein